MTTGKPISQPVTLGAAALRVATTDPPNYYETGLEGLDDIIVGAVEGDLMVIAGAPSQGKTSLAMQILENAATTQDAPVGIFSLEMSPEALAMRMIASRAKISTQRILKKKRFPLSSEENDRLVDAAKFYENLPIAIETIGGLSGDRIYQIGQEWQKRGVKMMMLDYLGMMPTTGENRAVGVGQNAHACKNIARDCKVPFLLLSQLNRASGQREDKTPRLSDLRDSGDIEAVADVVIMFSYPNAEDKHELIREAEIHVLKQRQGPVGVANVFFDKVNTRFVDVRPEGSNTAIAVPAGDAVAPVTGWGNV